MATKQDEEFGQITDGGAGWLLERRATLSGAQIPIEVELDEDGNLEPQQRQAIRLALALGPDALEAAAPSVVQNYDVHREMIGDEQVPPLESALDAWNQVRIQCIRVPRHYGARHAYFLIDAECEWDEEHGLEIRFRDGEATETSQQGDTGGAQDDAPEQLDMIRQLIQDANAQFDS